MVLIIEVKSELESARLFSVCTEIVFTELVVGNRVAIEPV